MKKHTMKIIDTHQHLWDLDLFSYSWCKRIPSFNRSFRMPDYLKAVEGLELEQSVHVEADVDEPYLLAETRYLLQLADEDNPLQGVVAGGRPEHTDFEDYLRQIAGPPKLKGIRRVMHTQPDDLGTSPTLLQNVRLLARYGLSFDICVLARQLPVAIHLVKSCPQVAFILDHCGVPQVKEQALDPWLGRMFEISRFPNVVCKISGLVAYADPGHWTAEDLRPYIDPVIECFGWDRVLFGSDWPVCTLSASLKQWVEVLTEVTRNADEMSRRKLFSENARRVYRLK
ncbi:MAG: amidohydrolase [Acidobacteria bacterium]|nr:amidohydrolase [Acidobacteriota bacterium]